MKNIIENILKKYTLEYGFCDFSRIEPYLIQCRNLGKIPLGAKTVISVLFPYCLEEEKYENLNVSRYAAVPDYHIVANSYLEKIVNDLKCEFPDEEFVFFADNSPINEVYTACASGLGKLGKNGLLINEKYGSWVFIGEIVSTVKIDFKRYEISRCEGCGKCVKACPVKALDEENSGKDFCLSNISQKKSDVPEEYKALMKKYDCAWGCDICQKVCPHNIGKEKTSIKEFEEGFEPNVNEDVEIEGRAFAWRGEKVIRRNLKILNENKTVE